MSNPKVTDKALLAASENSVLEPIMRELLQANFVVPINDDEGIWVFNDYSGPPSGSLAFRLEDDHGHMRVVMSVNGLKTDNWGISVAATLCGRHDGAMYWNAETANHWV